MKKIKREDKRIFLKLEKALKRFNNKNTKYIFKLKNSL